MRYSNRYFDDVSPWINRETYPARCRGTIYNCVQLIANLAVALEPFLPFSSGEARSWLGLDNTWRVKTVPAGLLLPPIRILFQRIDKKTIEEEENRLPRI